MTLWACKCEVHTQLFVDKQDNLLEKQQDQTQNRQVFPLGRFYHSQSCSRCAFVQAMRINSIKVNSIKIWLVYIKGSLFITLFTFPSSLNTIIAIVLSLPNSVLWQQPLTTIHASKTVLNLNLVSPYLISLGSCSPTPCSHSQVHQFQPTAGA